jgi:hypothetical protein
MKLKQLCKGTIIVNWQKKTIEMRPKLKFKQLYSRRWMFKFTCKQPYRLEWEINIPKIFWFRCGEKEAHSDQTTFFFNNGKWLFFNIRIMKLS